MSHSSSGHTARELWISFSEMLSDAEREDLGLRRAQDPHIWIVRVCSALTDARTALRDVANECESVARAAERAGADPGEPRAWRAVRALALDGVRFVPKAVEEAPMTRSSKAMP